MVILTSDFLQIYPQRSPNSELLNQVTPLESLEGLLVIKWTINMLLVEQVSQSRPKVTLIGQISIQIQGPQNEFQSKTFNNLDVDNQMLSTCGSYEPFNNP